MNRTLLWLILGLSTTLHVGGFFLLRGVPVAARASKPQPATFTVTAEGFQVATRPAPSTPEPTDLIAVHEPAGSDALATVNKSLNGGDALKTRINSLHPNADTLASAADVISARRTVVFLLDKSGSMYEAVGGIRRIELATQELRKMIAQLDSRTNFNVILYAEKVITFQSESVPATGEYKMQALRFLQADTPCGGSTDFPAGLQSALTQKADTILVLTDGEFNAQDQALLTTARNLRLKYNAQAKLNVLGFYVRPDTNAGKLLARLCADAHGELQFWKLNTSRYAFASF